MANNYTLEAVFVREGSEVARLPLESASVEHRAMGGALAATLEIATAWTEEFTGRQGDVAVLLVGGQIHFTGRVGPVSKTVRKGVQSVRVQGWWPVFKEYRFITDSLGDHEYFGVLSEDHPDKPKAFDIADALVDALITPAALTLLPSPSTLLRKGGSTVFKAPPYSTKVGQNGFAVRQQDNLAATLETLATMDDAWAGVTGDGQVYYLHRSDMTGEQENGTFTGSPFVDVKVGDVNPLGMTLNDGELVEEGYPEGEVAVAGRDASLSTRAIRVYKLEGGSTRRRTFYVPGILKGAAARRFARGRFKRFGLPTVRLRQAEVLLGSALSVEPWRGRARFKDEDDTVLDQGVMGTVRVSYGPNVSATISTGEAVESDWASTDPAINPAAPPYQRQDDPIVDVGESSSIDFDDGQTIPGDGDDLHTNPARTQQNDIAPLGLDYGTDLANSDDIPSGGGGGSGSGAVGPVVIVSPDPPKRGLTCRIIYNPALRPLDGLDPIYLYWGINGFATITGPVVMQYNESAARWEVEVLIPTDAVELNFRFQAAAP